MEFTQPTQLYSSSGARLYINRQERVRFLKSAANMAPPVYTLCLTLVHTGCRISEALALTAAQIDIASQVIALKSLKKRRGRIVIREVPVPDVLLSALVKVHDINSSEPSLKPLWPWSRTQAWRYIKLVMKQANIHGAQATPKGLRHGFGVHAVLSGVQLNMLQKWLGHCSITVTSIYANASGTEEREIARRMWQ